MKVKMINNAVSFKCPGCKHYHTLPIAGDHGPIWGFNGDLARPTLTPSILATSGCYVDPVGCQGEGAEWCDRDKPADPDGLKVCHRCHSFVRDGQIQFLDDCTHPLAGQTVELAEIPPG